ncbi:MAG: asparagine synthase B, partial [Lentisphaeria bacterium]
MCGFVGMFDLSAILEDPDGAALEGFRQQVLQMSKKIRHRGPDWSGNFCCPKAILGHERLAIVDPLSGRQPLFSKDGKLVLAVNGEIYNHQDLRKHYAGKYEFLIQSDCEVILALYRDKGPACLEDLNGIF